MDRRQRFERWFDELATIGRAPGGGWHRFAWTAEDRLAREWFARTAESLCLVPDEDGNGNLWAWWGQPEVGSIVTGSHLDTVAGGGAYDGALGVVSALLAVDDIVRARSSCNSPPHPVAVVAFADEEGGRFNLPCFGSKLLTGALEPSAVLGRTDADGCTVAEAMDGFGRDPTGVGADPGRLGWIGAFVELHVEQGRRLADLDAPIAIGNAIWPHGRWRLVLTGRADHAGTTRLADRHDPVVVAAECTVAARVLAAAAGMVATVGRLVVEPNSPNTIAARVMATVDARAPDDPTIDGFVARLAQLVDRVSAEHGVRAELHLDSRTAGIAFDNELSDHVDTILGRVGIHCVRIPTAAGHDAGILASHVPTTMLFVRNPTGASHTPSEWASVDDCLVGVDALTAVLEDLAWA